MTSIKHLILSILFVSSALSLYTQTIPIKQSNLVGNGIVEFIPEGYDASKTPSLILKDEPATIGAIPADWKLVPEFSLVSGKAYASLVLSGNISLYGGGEVTGPLLRNGQHIKLWNTDSGAYGVDNGKRLYQSHPWVMGVREDGTAFGIIFDSSWKSELITNSGRILFNTEGERFRIYIIDRQSPKEVLKGLAELTGTIQMPALWTLGYHQSRFSYGTEAKVKEIANTFRAKNIPCDVVWMDIDYMNGYRVFTFNSTNFPNPKALNEELHSKGFKAVYMINPGVKAEQGYSIYDSGTTNDIWIKRPNGETYQGKVWPGYCAFPDFTMPQAREWWANQYQDFLAKDIDGVWNDMNEPSVNDDDIAESQRIGTIPYNTPHRGGGNLPAGSHLLYHNAYGRLMVEASLDGIMKAKPNKRPFLLTRSNLLGGQRYAATWTGDNWASDDHMKLSVPMSLTLGLSGQPFNGPDIGGFLNNTSGDLWANWLGFGVFLPFARGHANADTNEKEPWAFGTEIEKSSRIAIQRRYRLLPYIYTLFYDAHKTGIPVMNPVFFDDPSNLDLRKEQEAFLLGDNLLVIPAFAQNPALPSGIWEELSLVENDNTDKYQAKLKIKGGSIIPAGKIVQSTTEKIFDPLTLFVCLDKEAKAEGQLYWDSGDGWDFETGDYGLMTFKAERKGNVIEVSLASKEGNRNIENDINEIRIKVLTNGHVYEGTGLFSDEIISVIVPKQEQTILFDAITVSYLGQDNFDPGAESSSGLPVTYSTSNANVATVVDGKIHLVGVGDCIIYADQPGDANYNPATRVSQTLTVEYSTTEVKSVKIDGMPLAVADDMYYKLDCQTPSIITIEIEPMPGGIVDKGDSFTLNVETPGIYTIPFSVLSQGSTTGKDYTLNIEKPFSLNDVVKIKWNNTLMLNVNKLKSFGYEIVGCQWYKAGILIPGETNYFYSAGSKASDVLSNANTFGVEVTTRDNKKIRSCDDFLTLKSNEVSVYPNPVQIGVPVNLLADIDDKLLIGAVIEVCDIAGNVVMTVDVESKLTTLSLPQASGLYILKLKGKDGFVKILKSIVK